MVVPQSVQVPANAVYRKHVEGVWQDFVVNANNIIASAPGGPSFCPPPGDALYLYGLDRGPLVLAGAQTGDGSVNNSGDDPGGVTDANC